MSRIYNIHCLLTLTLGKQYLGNCMRLNASLMQDTKQLARPDLVTLVMKNKKKTSSSHHVIKPHPFPHEWKLLCCKYEHCLAIPKGPWVVSQNVVSELIVKKRSNSLLGNGDTKMGFLDYFGAWLKCGHSTRRAFQMHKWLSDNYCKLLCLKYISPWDSLLAWQIQSAPLQSASAHLTCRERWKIRENQIIIIFFFFKSDLIGSIQTKAAGCRVRFRVPSCHRSEQPGDDDVIFSRHRGGFKWI